MSTKIEVVANANAHLNDAGLPTYNDAITSLRDADAIFAIARAHMSSEQFIRFCADIRARGMDQKEDFRRMILERTAEIA